MEKLIDAKVFFLRMEGRVFEQRVIEALRHWLLRGLPEPPPPSRSSSGTRPEEMQTVAAGGVAHDGVTRGSMGSEDLTDSPQGTAQPDAASSSASAGERCSLAEDSVHLRLQRRLDWGGTAAEAARVEKEGSSLLLFAVIANDFDAVTELLCEEGEGRRDVNRALKITRTKVGVLKGITPLHMAMMFSSWRVVEALLRAGANPNAALTNGFTPLIVACISNRVDHVTAWLAHFPSCNLGPIPNVWRDTPLHAAVQVKISPETTTLVRALLAAKASASAEMTIGSCPLHLAALTADCDVSVITTLLGAPNAPDINARQQPRTLRWRALLYVLRVLLRIGASAKALRLLGPAP